MTNILLALLAVINAGYLSFFVRDLRKAKTQQTDQNNPSVPKFVSKSIVTGFVANFFDALGIGSYAIMAAFMKTFKLIKDKDMPGTINVGYSLPVFIEGLIFIKVVAVDPITLIAMVTSAAFGAWFGADIVSRFSERKIQMVMGLALLFTAFIMLAGKFHLLPNSGGDALGFTYGKLGIACAGNFLFGALSAVGIGLYAPCMALTYFLGLSSRAVFPIMMGSCAFLTPFASIRFIKNQAYDKKASLIIGIAGVVGVIIAAYVVKSLPLNILQWLVIVVVGYTAFIMLKAAHKNAKKI